MAHNDTQVIDVVLIPIQMKHSSSGTQNFIYVEKPIFPSMKLEVRHFGF